VLVFSCESPILDQFSSLGFLVTSYLSKNLLITHAPYD
jgi:hypothetical protein